MRVKDLKTQVRLLGALLATALGGNMLTDALRILSEQTVTSKVARLSAFPEALAACLAITAALVLPYFFLQALSFFERYRINVTRLACWAVMAGGVIEAYLGYLSKNLDYKYITAIFIAVAIVNFAMAASLAYGLSAAQRRAEDGQK